VTILRQKAQAFNFIEIIRKINDQQMVSHQELQDAITKAHSFDSLPAYLATTL
jgi:DNA-directed RNA polymerase delta subunit